MLYKNAIRPILFTQDPESAHERTIELLASASGLALKSARKPFTHSKLAVRIAGIDFPNPVGLAAGCDKNAKALLMWPQFGFGFVETGTVTAQPQPGNPRPRVFRFPQAGALINRLGFNSEGSEAVAKRIAKLRRARAHLPVPLGINIGKTKAVSGEDATLDDYRTSYRRLSRLAEFVVVNVSSPNTPGLRQWQEKDKLAVLLGMLMEESRLLAVKRQSVPTPLFVKISPDMDDGDMADAAAVALGLGLAGIIATNTTIARSGTAAGFQETGGLSGKPLRNRAAEVLRFLYNQTQGALPLIGVGGIFSAEDAYFRIQCGASLVQCYTALVYEGPFLPRYLNQGLLKLMERDGIKHISELVGTAA